MNDFAKLLKQRIFATVGAAAHEMGQPAYVVGGFVRDLILQRPSTDVDFVTVGSGIELAKNVAHRLGRGWHLAVFRNYGTAQVKRGDHEYEFVGARKESYQRDSRNPIVEDGTLDDDIARRDFTINAMAVSVSPDDFGTLVDHFDGIGDIARRIIRTPLDPDVTFSDDPLRMMRAVRFAAQLQFNLHPLTAQAIARNAQRLKIISRERITTELQKIMASPRPSVGWQLMHDTGLLPLVMPELEAMHGVTERSGHGHKENFSHTMQVLDNVAAATPDVWTRWAALLHDIGKPVTKRWDDALGWTFHNHNFVGAKMVPKIFSRLGLPMGEEMQLVKKLVDLHMRPSALGDDEVTDSAVRRLINYAEAALPQLMILARADITTKNEARRQRFLDNYDIVEQKFQAINALDADRAFRPALNGNDIMRLFDLPQSPEVGYYMSNLTRVSKDCEIEPTRQAALDYVVALARERNQPINEAVLNNLIANC